jgi:hypothetical protein
MKSKAEAAERPLLYSVEEMRTKLRGFSRGHFYILLARGTLQAARIGGPRMVTATSIYRTAGSHDDTAEAA